MRYGIIMELNPFHKGHEYFLDEVKKKAKDNFIIAVISTSTVQRGELSVLEKKYKTENLLKHGVDLVIGMPFLLTNQGGEYFAQACIDVLNKFDVDEIICGSESNDINKIKSNIKNNTKRDFKKGYLKKELIGFDSNDILAMSYYKAIKKTNPNIKLSLIKRENTKKNGFVTATELREIHENNLEYKKEFKNSIDEDIFKNMKYFNMRRYFEFLKYNLIVNENKDIFLSDNGELIKVLKKNINANNMNELIKFSSNKNVSKYKVQRLILNILLNVESKNINTKIKKVHVLGFNIKVKKLLKNNKNIFYTYKDRDEIYNYDVKLEKLIFGDEINTKPIIIDKK